MSSPISIKLTGCGVAGSLIIPSDVKTIAEIRTLINTQYGIQHAYRILFKGRILRDTDLVTSITFTSESKFMLVKSAEQKQAEIQAQVQAKNDRYQTLKQAVQALAKRKGDDENLDTDRQYYLELTDQNGSKLDISENDRYTLVTGMTLHTKGNAALKRGDYVETMEMFQLADESFQLCDEKFLNLIDNDKYLALDIVWTLFLQQDLTRLADAQKWLTRAENGFRRVHGPNMERLRAIRQGFIPEMALYVRLYLLQAVVYYHIGDIVKAHVAIQKAHSLNEEMIIDDIQLATLISAGYQTKHASRALRACRGNVDAAATYLITHREKEEQRAKARIQEREQKKLGKTMNGQAINMRLLEALQHMGYEKWICVEAIRQCDNNQEAIMTLLTDPTRFSVLQATVHAKRDEILSQRGLRRPSYSNIITQLMGMGFDAEHVTYAVRVNHGDVTNALALLTQPDVLSTMMTTNPLPDVPITSTSTSTPTTTSSSSLSSSSSSSDPPTDTTSSVMTDDAPSDALTSRLDAMSDTTPVESEEEKKKREAEELKRAEEKQREDAIDSEIHNQVVPDLETEDDDPEAHLDVDLTRETEAIHTYMVLMGLVQPEHQQPQPASPAKAS